MLELQSVGISHSAVKDLFRVQRNATTRRPRLVLAEGLWAAKLLLELGVRVDTFFYCPDLVHSADARTCAVELTKLAKRSFQVSEKVMKRMAKRDAPEGLLSLAEMPEWRAEELVLNDAALIVVTDGIESPGNLGTLLRTADGAKADLLVLTKPRTSVNHPTVFPSSRGMSLKVPHLEFPNPSDAIQWLKMNKVTVYLADTDDSDESLNYHQVDYHGRTAIVLGSERFGLSSDWYEHEFLRVRIPMLGRSDSLNLSVAASILLYEARACKQGW